MGASRVKEKKSTYLIIKHIFEQLVLIFPSNGARFGKKSLRGRQVKGGRYLIIFFDGKGIRKIRR